MGNCQLTLWVDEDIRRECQEKRWHYAEIFLMGMESKRGMPKILERINELEAGNKKLQGALSRYWTQLAEIQNERDQLKNGTKPQV